MKQTPLLLQVIHECPSHQKHYISYFMNRCTKCFHIIIGIPHSCFEYAGIYGFHQFQHSYTELSSRSKVLQKLGHLLVKDCFVYEF